MHQDSIWRLRSSLIQGSRISCIHYMNCAMHGTSTSASGFFLSDCARLRHPILDIARRASRGPCQHPFLGARPCDRQSGDAQRPLAAKRSVRRHAHTRALRMMAYLQLVQPPLMHASPVNNPRSALSSTFCSGHCNSDESGLSRDL
jgi:hypothetical protein